MATTLKLYSILASQSCRSVYSFLQMTDIPYEYYTTIIWLGANRTKEFRNINPLCTVPTIEDGNLKLCESEAILMYLSKKYTIHVPDHMYSRDVHKRAKVDQYMSWHHNNTQLSSRALLLASLIEPMKSLRPPDQKQVEEALKNVQRVCIAFEDIWLQGDKYIAGDQISIADLLAFHEWEGLVGSPYTMSDVTPKLNSWYHRTAEEIYQHWPSRIRWDNKMLYLNLLAKIPLQFFKLIPRF